jgi:transcriptional regulator GlxA family with amidase domain
MSDFSLPELARRLEKSPRTIRRWCERGLVPGAYRTTGGHWRIADAPADLVKTASEAAKGFARKRAAKGSFQKFGERITQWAKEIQRLLRPHLAPGEAVLEMLAGQPAESRRLLFEIPINSATTRTQGIASLMISTGDFEPSAQAIARKLGVSRRTVYRRYGRELRKARLAALVLLGVRNDGLRRTCFDTGHGLVEAEDFDFAAIDARLGFKEPSAA